jgi:hypothetical protein
MTAQQETRFRCDRCGTEQNIPLENKPIYQRVPEGWLAIVLKGEDHVHLCAGCASGFQVFMAAPT